jgi:hypothetical protein
MGVEKTVLFLNGECCWTSSRRREEEEEEDEEKDAIMDLAGGGRHWPAKMKIFYSAAFCFGKN